ncbi:hypothetical protein [Alteromonas macleodii]|uniref:hypothetical protein n=1 Tax=Alteromonas macleodii TaxID=28108 RepID=UPI00313E90D6
MEETLDSITYLVSVLGVIALVSIIIGHIIVSKILVAKGMSASKSKLVGSGVSALLIVALSFFFVVPL